MTDESVFAEALAIGSPTERAAYLDRACAGNPALRAEVQALLDAHAASNALDRPPIDVARTGAYAPERAADPDEALGSVLAGKYKLVELIGAGGMGAVYMAQQTEPVKRLVAVKVIRDGMDTRQVLARFEAERQALALMDHPNIAKVLDAGTTDRGRPFFVMELVKGVPITEFCDARKLSPRERLELFVPVCQAIQHAHQKGVIHRDIKPSNVLVALYDGKPVPKVIDFGVAKAAGQPLTDKTLVTGFGAIVGTPEYMSPEQAELNQLDIDTRSDVFALGVLLYELLTGTTPLNRSQLGQAALLEVLRIVREVEPPKPSTRISTSGTLANIAANRNTDPARLSGLMRGELDWIVMKALEKDRNRRYESATALAKDVERHLRGDAVEACPPTLGYRLRKAYRRNRAAVLGGGAFALVLLTGVCVSVAFAYQADRARRGEIDQRNLAELRRLGAIEERDKATQAMRRATEQEQLAREHAQAAAKSAADARSAANEREGVIVYLSRLMAKFNPYKYPDGKPPISVILDEVCRDLDRNDEEKEALAKLSPVVRAKVRGAYGQMLVDVHKHHEGQEQLKRAHDELRQLKGEKDLDTISALEAYANALVVGRTDKETLQRAEGYLTQVYNARVEVQPTGHPDVLKTLTRSLAVVQFLQMEFPKVRDNQRRALELALANPDLGDEHKITADMRLGLANMLARTPEPAAREEAHRLCDRAIQTLTRLHGENHPDTLNAKMHLRFVDDETGDFGASVKQLYELVQLMVRALDAKQNDRLLRSYDTLALQSLTAGRPELAAEATEKLVKLGPDVHGVGHPYVRRYHSFRAWYYIQVGMYREAEEEAKVVFSERFKDLDGLNGSWDDFPKAVGNAVLAKCLLQKPNLTEDDLKRAQDYLLAYKNPIETAPKRFGAPNRREKLMRAHVLRIWIELYEKWKKPKEAEQFQMKLDALHK